MRTRFEPKLLIASACLPVVATLIAFWGSTWGWNSDGKLGTELPLYVLSAYLIIPLPEVVAYQLSAKFGRVRVRVSSRAGLAFALWGVYTCLSSVALLRLFDSDSLWLGTVGVFYLGFIATVLASIRVLA